MTSWASRTFSAIAPFGRLGHALGWRWAMPIGTLPLPYHPWIARLVPWLIPALLIGYPVAQAIETGTMRAFAGDWARPLWIALVLAIPLSVPILQWLAFLFRIPLLQLLLAPAAMFLLVVAVAVAAEPVAMAAIPALYFGWHAVGAIGARILLRRLRARAAMLEGALRLGAPGDPPMLLVDGNRKSKGQAPGLAREAITALDQPLVYHRSVDAKTGQPVTTSLWRIAPGEIEAIREMAADLPGCSIQRDKANGHDLVELKDDHPSDPVIEAVFKPWSAGRGPLKGALSVLSVRRPGQAAADYVHGSAAGYGWLPGFSLFYVFSLTGQGRWQFGFPRTREVDVGQAKTIGKAFAALAIGQPSTDLRYADPAALHAVLQRRFADLFAEQLASLDALLADPAQWRFRHLKLLGRSPEVLGERADAIWRVLIDCRDRKLVAPMRTLAALVAEFPARAFAARGQDIITLLNSRAVAGGSRRVTVSVANLKAGNIPFAGFDLLSAAPRLYARLGELGEPARSLIMALGELAEWPPSLVEARDRLG